MTIACTAPGKVCNKYCKLNNFSAICRKKRFGIPKKVKAVKELIESDLTVIRPLTDTIILSVMYSLSVYTTHNVLPAIIRV